MTGRGCRSGQRPKKRPKTPNKHSLASLRRQIEKGKAGPSKPPESASKKKLIEENASVCPEREAWSGLRVVDIDLLFENILEHVTCRKCRGPLSIYETNVVGLSSIFEIKCSRNCGVLKEFRNCKTITNATGKTVSEANRRIVYASQVMGFKDAGLKLLSAIMDFPSAVSTSAYIPAVSKIHEALKLEATENMAAAAKLEAELEGCTDIGISGDGSWQRRGFSSKNGVVTAIGVKSGKVIDVEVMSTVCQGCSHYNGSKSGPEYEEWLEEHSIVCQTNHEGSSGMMEVTGMINIFKRSVAERGVRYARYVGDGDAKTFSNIEKEKPYGNDLVPRKIECTGHVQKRMGTRLRKLKKELKGKKLKDGKPIGGKGRLTDKQIDKIASFYGNAIRSSKDAKEMKDKTWAIFHHYRSSDKNPEHHLCPTGEDSWCGYNKAVSKGEDKNYTHKSAIPEAVMDTIKPIFKDLTSDDLLEKCVGGFTQNPNESLNSVIWKVVPKIIYCGRKVLELGVFEAVLLFNNGQKSHLKVMGRLGVTPGKSFVKYCNVTDAERVKRGQRRSLDSTKEARKAKRRQDQEEREAREGREGLVYGGGAF